MNNRRRDAPLEIDMRCLDRDRIDHLVITSGDIETKLITAAMVQFAAYILEQYPEQIEVFEKKYGEIATDLVAPEQ